MEDLVAEICRTLLERYSGQIGQCDILEADVEFAIPATLKRLILEKGIDPDTCKLHVGWPVITKQGYGAVQITIGGRPT